MSYLLSKLSCFNDALDPYFDTKTMEVHRSSHHHGSTETLRPAIKDTLAGVVSIEEKQ